MILRNRHKTHGGIPHGSTLNFGTNLQIYLRHKEGIVSSSITTTQEDDSTSTTTNVSTWHDQSSNEAKATQTTNEARPLLAADGSLDFFHDADGGNADFMNFTSFRINANGDFLTFIVCDIRDVNTCCYLSDSGGETLEFHNENTHKFRGGGAISSIQFNSDASVTTPNNEKMLVMVHRTNGSTGTIMGYKNGLQADSSITNAGQCDFTNLGSVNDSSKYFDGKIYDIGVIEATVRDDYRNRIVDHLLSKHGLERLA